MTFHRAQPIFLAGLDRTPGVQAGFYWRFRGRGLPETVVLRVAAATSYRAYVNGVMVANGPARAAHGVARVDQVAVPSWLCAGPRRHLAIEVAGHATECIATTGDPSFVQAELLCDGEVVAASDETTEAVRLPHRRPAERFSHARPAGEVWRLDAEYGTWRQGGCGSMSLHPVERVPGPGRLLPRGVPWPDGRSRPATFVLGFHSFERDPSVVIPPIGPLEHGPYLDFVATLTERPAVECAAERSVPLAGRAALAAPADVAAAHLVPPSPVAVELSDLRGPAGVDFDFAAMQAGFLHVDVTVPDAATIDVVFVDHLEPDGTINARTGDMNGVVRLHVPAGRTRFTAFEPHAFRYVRVVARGTTALTLHELSVIDHAHPDTLTGPFRCDDDELNRIYAAARLTLRLNTQDVFMDCPGRERAGWLCDSLFSARAMSVLFGDTRVERAMLENFLHAPESAEHPGYFPECYPGRRIEGGNFIPNWSMFLGLQLAEYVARAGDFSLRDAYRERVERLVAGIERSAGPHGLLQDLPGFTFVDWSAANEDAHKRPISTATNALYAKMLDGLADLYARDDWRRRADAIRRTLRRHVPADGPIPDALRPDGDTLVPAGPASEAAQYYHYWTGVADPDGPQWERLVAEYGPAPDRPPTGDVLPPSNVFIGLYLRLDVLARTGDTARLIREMKALFLPMLARGPGTLWEHRRLEGSVCHGFASYAAVWLVRHVRDAVPRS